MEAQKFRELVVAPALESIGTQLMDTSNKLEQDSKTVAEYLRIAAGYVMLAHQELRGEENA